MLIILKCTEISESLCYAPRTNIVFYVNYTSKTNRIRDQICGYHRWVMGGWETRGRWAKGMNCQ